MIWFSVVCDSGAMMVFRDVCAKCKNLRVGENLVKIDSPGLFLYSQNPGSRVEELEGCGMKPGIHTSLARLGYVSDTEGNKIDPGRIESGLLKHCEKHLGRSPGEPVEWTPGILA